MNIKKCVGCSCGFRPDEDENLCKNCKDRTDLSEGQKLKAGIPIPGHKKVFTEDEIRKIVKEEIEIALLQETEMQINAVSGDELVEIDETSKEAFEITKNVTNNGLGDGN